MVYYIIFVYRSIFTNVQEVRMIKIAICDDESEELHHISTLLELYRRKKKAALTYHTFQSATELLSVLHSKEYDVIILDIIMPNLSGMEAAYEIRDFDQDVKLVFLTCSPEFAVESYSVKAHDYLVKPITEENLFTLLDQLITSLTAAKDALIMRTKSSILHIPYDRIEYLEINAKKLYFNLTDGSAREMAASLSDFEQLLLTRPEFIKVHRSYIVNMLWIQEFSSKKLSTVCGKQVPVARSAYPRVRTSYLDFLFERSEESHLE